MISIVIPTYNRRDLLKRTIKSIEEQLYQDWECIVVDDFSTDNTKEIVEQIVQGDNRFSYFLNERTKGAQGARNTGILAAKGDWIVLFDSDNIMHPDFLQKVYNAACHNNCDVCGCFSKVVEFGTEKEVGAFVWSGYGSIHPKIMKCISYFDNSSTLIRRQKLLDIELLDENCPAYQEWDTHIRLSKIVTYTTVEEKLVDYYVGGADTISKSLEKDIRGILYILKKYEHEWLFRYPKTYFLKLYGTYCNLQKVQVKDKYIELRSLYKKNSVSIFRIFVYMIYKMKRL